MTTISYIPEGRIFNIQSCQTLKPSILFVISETVLTQTRTVYIMISPCISLAAESTLKGSEGLFLDYYFNIFYPQREACYSKKNYPITRHENTGGCELEVVCSSALS